MQSTDILIYVLMCCITVPLGILINLKLYRNIKNEEHLEKGKLVQRIMKTFSLLQCFTWPLFTIFLGVFSTCNSVFEISEDPLAASILTAFRFAYNVNRDYVSFNSLIIAISRYILVVYERQAEKFGIQRLRTLLIRLCFGVPIFSNLLYEAVEPKERVWFSLLYNDTIDIYAKRNNSFQNEDPYESQMYLTFNRYMPTALMDGMKVLNTIVLVILYANIIEGFIYTHVFIIVFR